MTIAAISSVASPASFGVVPSVATASASQGGASLNATDESTSSSKVTNVVTMTDGATVTTVRDKAGQIISITTSPPTRPQETYSPQSSSPSLAASGGRINLTA